MLPRTPHADIRAALARYELPLYVLAARVRVHPVRLGRMLRGRRPLPPDLAAQLLREIEREAAPTR
jgi:hypothetical protein